jgi:hypothetical protein
MNKGVMMGSRHHGDMLLRSERMRQLSAVRSVDPAVKKSNKQ